MIKSMLVLLLTRQCLMAERHLAMQQGRPGTAMAAWSTGMKA